MAEVAQLQPVAALSFVPKRRCEKKTRAIRTFAARPLFDEDWWLDAAAPGAWDRVQAVWDGELVGEMTFHLEHRWGFRHLRMPHLTRTMSPRLLTPKGKAATVCMNNRIIVSELLGKLPAHDRFERALDPNCASLQGFVHAGMTATHLFTYRSRPGESAEDMLRLSHQEARRAINKAMRDCSVERSLDLDRFIRLHRDSYAETSRVRYSTLERLFSAVSSRGQAEIVIAKLNGGEDTAAMILAWDSEVAYTWVFARNRRHNYVGATSLLTYESMRTAHRIGRVLDLDGYLNPKVGEFQMKFGLQPVVRPYVNWGGTAWRRMQALKSVIEPNRRDGTFWTP